MYSHKLHGYTWIQFHCFKRASKRTQCYVVELADLLRIVKEKYSETNIEMFVSQCFSY